MLKKSTFREIKNSLGRYIAILAIVALGVGFFSGLKVTKEAMVRTADKYISTNRLFDYRLISTLGFEDNDIKSLEKMKSVEFAEGSISKDALFDIGNNKNYVISVHSITNKINQVQLTEGRMPQKSNEFIGDNRFFNKDDIGKTIILSSENDKDTKNIFKEKKFTLTGLAKSPYYLNFERGSSSLGNGTVSGFIYLNNNAFDIDYSTEVFLTLNNHYEVYSDEYADLIKNTEDDIKAETKSLALNRYQKIIDEAEKKIREGETEYQKNYNKLEEGKNNATTLLSESRTKLNQADSDLTKHKSELAIKEKELEEGQNKLNSAVAEYQKHLNEFESIKDTLPPEIVSETEKQLKSTEKMLAVQKSALDEGYKQLRDGKLKLEAGEAELSRKHSEYEDAKRQAPSAFNDAEKKLQNARMELDDAKSKLLEIEKPETFVLDRNTNIGYSCFESDSNIVDGIAKVFPIFFFLVAALVCMTTMTRMIDEQRTQIGVLKALGYSNGAIMGKYLFYSGSASLIGCIVGFLGGCYIFPRVIWAAYQIMYNFDSHLQYVLNWPLALISLGCSLLCSMGATILSCYNEFREVPAELIRPKAPKVGKRILLERITFIWKHIGFLYKVSFRNIFRYKKRFLMMVLGISGCTALLVTGFGLKDSIKNIVNYQYDDIQIYDYSVNFNNSMSLEMQTDFKTNTEDHIKEILFVHQSANDLLVEDKVKSINLIAVDEKSKDFNHFINLEDTDHHKILYPKENEAVICQKLAEDYHLKKGDTITLRNKNMKKMSLKVTGICRNYVYNYIYVIPASCEEQWGETPEIKCAFVNTKSNENDEIYASSAKTLKQDNVVAASVNNDFRIRVNNMMRSLDYVIILVIVAAGALAFIVLYNLTNINITERIREIATIKVLGFYPNETSAYVFRENIFLTAISAVVGLFAGKWLHAFVMSQIKIDMIFFDAIVLPSSYLFSVLLTFAFAIVVNLVMYYKLEKINMTESLKSIE